MAQSSDFPLRKPPGFHWDFFLLGITTFLAGILGLPAPNGLIPQAPIHTTSLLVMGHPLERKDIEEDATIIEAQTPVPPSDAERVRTTKLSALDKMISEVPVSVVEQRVSNLAQGSLCLVLLTGPFLHVLNLIPRGELIVTKHENLPDNWLSRRIGWLIVIQMFAGFCLWVSLHPHCQLVHGRRCSTWERDYSKNILFSSRQEIYPWRWPP